MCEIIFFFKSWLQEIAGTTPESLEICCDLGPHRPKNWQTSMMPHRFHFETEAQDNLELTYWNAALSQSIEAFNYVNCTWIDIKYTGIISWLKSSHCSSCILFLCFKKTEQYCLEGYIFHLVKCAIVYQVLRVATHWKLDLLDFALNFDNIKRQVKPQAP